MVIVGGVAVVGLQVSGPGIHHSGGGSGPDHQHGDLLQRIPNCLESHLAADLLVCWYYARK